MVRWNPGRERFDLRRRTEERLDSVRHIPGHGAARALIRDDLITHRSNGTGFSVPQAVGRSVGDRKLCRTSQLRPQSGNRLPVTRHGKLFRARNLFRCVNQQGQPQALAACRSPFPELLTHRLSFWSVRCQGQSGSRGVVPDFVTIHMLAQRKSDRCDLLHKSPRRFVLDLRHGRETVSSVVRYRHQDRLRLDRHRRGRCRVRVHLPDPGLIKA